MKSRVLLIAALFGILSFGISTSCNAQKFALLDMEYILKLRPAAEIVLAPVYNGLLLLVFVRDKICRFGHLQLICLRHPSAASAYHIPG